MLVKHLQVEITKDKMTKVRSLVPQWEAQVLVAAWGDDAAVISEQWVARPDGSYEPNAEFARLAEKYGPRDEEVPTVAKVFGSFGPGIRALQAEMQIALKVGPNSQDNPISSTSMKDNEELVGLMPIPEDGEDGADSSAFIPLKPTVRDDTPALAGNTFEVGGGEAKLSYEDLAAAGAVDEPEPVDIDIDIDIDDLTDEDEGDTAVA